MIRRLPLIPTLLVALAVAAMVVLGIWQLSRAREKDALVERYEAARNLPQINFPTMPIGEDLPLFRRAQGYCLEPVSKRVTAGRNRAGESGYIHIVNCRTGAEGPGMAVQVGWSKDPQAGGQWRGGPVSGVIAPDSEHRMRLVADLPAPGLEPSEMPTTQSIPNNHLAYAAQWFLFAAIAVVIYLLALRSRLAVAARTRQENEPLQ
jgi:cytochrome oxidase assembly protein ShyY1